MKKLSIITILLILYTTVNYLASGIYYLPDVTSEMSSLQCNTPPAQGSLQENL